MEDMKMLIALVFVLTLVLFILYSVGRVLGVWTWSVNWILSTREEKVNLTRSEGHYNANGYLVPAESTIDINLCHSGSFKRFETVDQEYILEMADFTTEPTQPQPPEQRHEYPEDFAMPFRAPVMPDNLYDDPQPSCSYSHADQYEFKESTTVFVSSSPTQAESSTAFIQFPPQPLRPAPSPEFVVHEKYESEKPEKVKFPPRRPPPPVFDQVVPPPVPPRIQPPPLPPRRVPVEQPIERDEFLSHIQGLLRGVSFESFSSDTSVALGDLDGPHVTGYLCVGVDFANEAKDVSVTIWEAKELTGVDPDGRIIKNTFAKVCFFPDKNSSVQTKICRNSRTPSYNERFVFHIEAHEYYERVLNFHVYSAGAEACFLIGEGELRLCDIPKRQSVTTWITLTDTGQFQSEWGEIMLSLNYLPTAERLTVVVVKAQNLSFPDDRESGDPFVKVYILRRGKKLFKKKTTTKRNERNPIFNEAMIFNVSPAMLENVQVRVTVAENTGEPRSLALGHVFFGYQAIGKCYTHWVHMTNSPRRPISMWHCLAK